MGMDEFEKIKLAKNPETPRGLLPLKDVITRWNSKEAAIARVLRLRETVMSFTTRTNAKKCPKFNKAVFDALLLIQPSLKVFLNLTQVYSEVGAHAYRVIPDLIDAMEQLHDIHQHPSVSSARRTSSANAIKKLDKYLKRFLRNKWLTAALALDPTVREEGLKRLLTQEYKATGWYERTIDFIKERITFHQAQQGESGALQEDDVQWVQEPKRANKFASRRFQPGRRETAADVTDPWACYNLDIKRFETKENEPVLVYWKRMSMERELRPLALAAKDILGLASSSASVERLFSQSGFVLGRKRGSLSAKMLAKQTSLRVWEQQGFLSVDDL
ncbi:hypothetical protein QFC19_008609 [Naganishia cerealis]|uniref:Uncharacterized protein n=1 Tax=Naganishia cerealis TaxID=610337 RepID=A0ACC2V267_9TREE|nr:hypothetical protein QFC19_008609 [Naganishia cerealis]